MAAAFVATIAIATTATLAVAATAPPPASAATGGLSLAAKPRIKDVVCAKECVSRRQAVPGSLLTLRGSFLDRTRKVVFPGRSGPIRVRARWRSRGAVRVDLPRRAVAGRPYVVNDSGKRSNRSPQKLEVLPKSALPIEFFPVAGPVSFGSAGARFGAGRSGHTHQGQDVLASCGTRLVSVMDARVTFNRYQGAAGNYVVLHNLGTRTDFAYMHLRSRSNLKVGQKVRAGQTVGHVGATGDATGCHLHFEYWRGPWQQGGHPIDPLPFLRSLLRERRGRRG